MKHVVHKADQLFAYAKLSNWFKLIAVTGLAQAIVQAFGFVCGILVIRLLPTHEYGLYTLVNMMVGTMVILADGGISIGMMGLGGKIWQDKAKLGALVASGLYLRKKFAVCSFLMSGTILFFLLRHHGASAIMSGLLLVSLLPTFVTTLTGTLLEIAPKLHQDIMALQKIQMSVNFGRLSIVALTVFIFPWAFIAILAGGLPQMFANRQLSKISADYTDQNQRPDAAMQLALVSVVKKILPTSVYFCLSGQITIWLVSAFGSTTSLAQIGALGRIAMVFTVFHILFATLVTPRFAKLPDNKGLLVKRFLQLQFGVLGVIVCIITATWLSSSQILWVLGEHYRGLESELILMSIGTCLLLVSGVAHTLYTCRSWVIKPIVFIPVNVAAILISIQLFDVSTLQGILMLNILVAAVQVCMNVIFVMYKMFGVQSTF